jgi:hypothetical protein
MDSGAETMRKNRAERAQITNIPLPWPGSYSFIIKNRPRHTSTASYNDLEDCNCRANLHRTYNCVNALAQLELTELDYVTKRKPTV